MRQPIYLDYHASTPVDPRVLEAMLPYFGVHFGNPSSRNHAFGWQAERAVGDARIRVLELLGGKSPAEVVFTSGATESNNLAIRGVLEAAGGGHIVTSAIEHACVLETCHYLESQGVEVTYVKPRADGCVREGDIEAAIRPHTRLISVMAVNNEVGTIQPYREIGAIARKYNVLFHCDAAQAVGRVPLDVARDHIDLLSMSGHKIYGPKGVGALYVRDAVRTRLMRQMHGGGQERNMRSGTLNVPCIVGLGEAARIMSQEMQTENARQRKLRNALELQLRLGIPRVIVNGNADRRVDCTVHFRVPGVRGDSLINAVPQVAFSGGAACASGKAQGSHVLLAMGASQETANAAVRLTVGRATTNHEVNTAAALIVRAASQLAPPSRFVVNAS